MDGKQLAIEPYAKVDGNAIEPDPRVRIGLGDGSGQRPKVIGRLPIRPECRRDQGRAFVRVVVRMQRVGLPVKQVGLRG